MSSEEIVKKDAELLKKLEEVCKLAPERRHSYFQLKYFVIGKEVTTQGQMWQCLREIQIRKDSIENLISSIEETKDQIEICNIKQERLNKKGKSNNRLWVVRCRQMQRKEAILKKTLTKLEEDLQFVLQEARFFLQMLDTLMNVEDLKDYDDLEAQKEYWNEKVSQQINLRMLLQQPLDIETVKTALSLHEDSPIRKQTEKTLLHIKDKMERLKDKYLECAKEHNATSFNKSQ